MIIILESFSLCFIRYKFKWFSKSYNNMGVILLNYKYKQYFKFYFYSMQVNIGQLFWFTINTYIFFIIQKIRRTMRYYTDTVKNKKRTFMKSDRIMQIGTSCVMRCKATSCERVGSALYIVVEYQIIRETPEQTSVTISIV